jgi:hypothetical protein
MSDEQETPNSEQQPEAVTTEEEATPSLVTEKTPTEESKEEAPTEEAPTAEPIVVDDITFPEGVEVNSALVDEFLGVVNNNDLSPKERAQALVDLQVKAMTEASEAGSQQFAEMQTKWRDEVKADPEFAGEKLQPALGRIGRLLSEYGTEELNGVFDLTGAGNNVHVVRFLHNIAGKLVEGEPAFGQPKTVETSAAQRLFPSMKG